MTTCRSFQAASIDRSDVFTKATTESTCLAAPIRRVLTTCALIALVVSSALSGAASAEGTIIDGFTIQPWLTGAGDIRGVTVGPGGAFGTDPYVYSFSQQSMLRVTGPEASQVFATGFAAGGTGRIVFGRGGAFGGDLYLSSPIDGAGPKDHIYRVTSGGAVSVFNQDFDFLTKGIAFGTGTAFGDSMFLVDAKDDVLQRLAVGGGSSPMGGGIVSGSWEDDMVITRGGGFGENAFVTDGIRDMLLRVTPGGLASDFAAVQGALSIAVGEGAFGDYLYVGTYQGNVYRVDSSGTVSPFISGFGLHSLEGNFRGIDIAGDVMWLTSDTGTLYRISPVPEPSTLLLAVVTLPLVVGIVLASTRHRLCRLAGLRRFCPVSPTRLKRLVAAMLFSVVYCGIASASSFTSINLSGIANDQLGLLNSAFPTGQPITLGGVPFDIAGAGNNIYNSDIAASHGPGSVVVSLPIGIPGVAGVHTLINTGWGQAGPRALADLTFSFTDATFVTVPLVGNQNIRDHFGGVFTNNIQDASTVNVFSIFNDGHAGPGEYRMDKQFFDLSAFASKTLASVTLTDNGAHEVQRTYLFGLTVQAVPEPSTLGLCIASMVVIAFFAVAGSGGIRVCDRPGSDGCRS